MMQAASFVTVVAAIFHHLSKVGYEIITPITVQQEQGAFSKSPSMGPSPKCLEVSPSEQDFCPVFHTENSLATTSSDLKMHSLAKLKDCPWDKWMPVCYKEENSYSVFLRSFSGLSPGDQNQCDIHQNVSSSTQSDSTYGVICNALIWIAVHFLWRQYQRFNSRDPARQEEDILAEGSVCPLLLDEGVLEDFYERCIRSAAPENWRVLDFVEGFSGDLLQALRRTLDREADLQVEDCIGVGSMYESWGVCKPLSCDLIVSLAPPKPYRFCFQLWCGSGNGIPQQAWGRIQLDSTIQDKTGCHCDTAGRGEDLLCLLHGPCTMTKENILENLLCSKDTAHLAKDQVMKWFQLGITKAWGQISHKYEFELIFRNMASPGALKVRFRSGKTIIFNLNPAIRFEDSDVYFVSRFPSNINSSSDTNWPLSFAVYESHLLKYLAKSLPGNSCHVRCLQIVSFLHKKQTGLTGKTSLSVYHFKTALFHLLLDKRPLDWSSNRLEHRARDILEFVWKSLRKKELRHALVGNGRVPEEIGIPASLRTARPINLFHPLALRKHLYTEAVKHFQEMLRNAAVLIEEYSQHLSGGN
ncbi:inositol 1,4,5-trisphosphate receptor-interacting protein [Conger conger]|uniref:inositol 1,4,5-trisphosphate receptor-interacting protein n=1 Tax=Conger conger TaxID=82655 RepID=UPI002A5A0587|nr:inositol 1,4,5-trisphosphate receptor-interacting protein [Conger conger]XP_061088404.1 inositol 1,4,5-trisphosphate receptor-interacting protein [Conger conger]